MSDYNDKTLKKMESEINRCDQSIDKLNLQKRKAIDKYNLEKDKLNAKLNSDKKKIDASIKEISSRKKEVEEKRKDLIKALDAVSKVKDSYLGTSSRSESEKPNSQDDIHEDADSESPEGEVQGIFF